MAHISKRMLMVEESPTLAISAKAKEMQANGEDVISLSVGEPDFETSAAIREAAVQAIMENKANHYTATAGILPLRKAIVQYHAQHDNVSYGTEEVLVTEGAKNALYTLFQVILNPGDEVIIPAPYWVSYPEQVKLAGGIPKIVDTSADNHFKAAVNQLEEVRTGKTTALILNSPNNPTGSIYTKDELEAIGEWAVQHQILIVSDEIYNRLCYHGSEAVSIASLSEAIKQQTITINGVSKTFAMTGWRIGYALGNKEIISKMTELSSHSTSNPAAPSQYAALAAISCSDEFVEKMKNEYEKRLDFFYPLLKSIPGFKIQKPEGAFYIFADVKEAAEKSGFSSVQEFTLALLEEAKVAAVGGEGFGFPDYIRISYTLEQDRLEEAVKRIKKFMQEKIKKE